MKEIFKENRKKLIDELSLFILLAKNNFVLVNINLSRFFPIPWIPWFRFDQIFTRLEFFFFSGSLLCANLRFKIAQFFFLYSQLYFDPEKYLSLDTRKVAINRGWRSKIRLSSTSGLFALIASRSSLTPSTCWSDWSLDTEMSLGLGSIIFSSLDVMAMCTKLNRPWWCAAATFYVNPWQGEEVAYQSFLARG